MRNLLDADSMVRAVHVASGLGATQRAHVAQAAGGRRPRPGHGRDDAADAAARRRPHGAPAETYAAWGRALGLPSVRGLVVGRALLYPREGDVATAVDVAADLVHGGVS